MNREPGDLVANALAFARVYPDADAHAKILQRVADGQGATHGTCRRLEAREEAVAGGVDLVAVADRELIADDGVMALQQPRPAFVAQALRMPGRIHDVREHQREQGGIVLVRFAVRWPHGGEQGLDLLQQMREVPR
nr:hypothetical protein [Variovorax sp. OV329]